MWGRNDHGQLGLPTNIREVLRPQQYGTDTDWVQISAGSEHTIALKANGSLWTCGYNASGQVGNGTTVDRTNLAPVTAEYDWKFITAALGNSYAIKTNGTLWFWGSDPSPKAQDYLGPVQAGKETNWRHASASSFLVFALQTNGTLWAGGHNTRFLAPGVSEHVPLGLTQIGRDSDWMEVYAGEGCFFGRKREGRWWICGGNSWGQLGIGAGRQVIRREMLQAPERWPFEMEPWAFTVSSGIPSTQLLTRDGVLWSWGARLGSPNPHPRWHPWKLRFNRLLYRLSGEKVHGISLQTEAIQAIPRKLWKVPLESSGAAEGSGR